MATAKRMRSAAIRKATRPKTTQHKSAKTQVHGTVYPTGFPYHGRTTVFLNPETKVGREASVDFHPREGWVFDYGQARSTYRFHKTRSAAMKEMKEYAKMRGIKYKPGKVVK